MQNSEQRINFLLRVLFIASVAVCSFVSGYLVFVGPEVPSGWLWLTLAAACALFTSNWLETHAFRYALIVQFCLAITLWGLMVAKAGGAMSSANALQLILVALIYLALPLRQALVTSLPLLAFQLYYVGDLWLETSAHEHQAHYAGMSVSFLLASVILAVVIYLLKHALADQQTELARLREEQLRQEQVIALATATVQMTHELATPLNTLSLWVDEITETGDASQQQVAELAPPLQHMKYLLGDLRRTTQAIYQERAESFKVASILHTLKNQLNLQFPQAHVRWFGLDEHSDKVMYADYSLLPALLNLLRNAIENNSAKEPWVKVHSWIDTSKHQHCWIFTIENEVVSFPEALLQQLGKTAVKSTQGLGIGTLLSHATLERFGGSLAMHYQEPILKQTVSLPLQ